MHIFICLHIDFAHREVLLFIVDLDMFAAVVMKLLLPGADERVLIVQLGGILIS